MRSFVRGFALLLLWPAASLAQVAYDSSCSVGGSNVSSISCNLTVSGSNRALSQGVTFFRNFNTTVGSGAYNSVATTAVPSGETNNGSNFVHLRYLIAPDTGTNSCGITYGGNAAFDGGLACISYTGVDQTTPIGTANTATGTSTAPSVTVASVGADDVVVDQLTIVHSGTLSVGANQTERVNAISPSGFLKYVASTQDGADGGVMSWSNSTSQAWSIASVAFKPVAVAAVTPLRTLRGVGP